MENEKIIEKIERKLTLYALYNSEGGSYDCFSISLIFCVITCFAV